MMQWNQILNPLFQSPKMQEIKKFLNEERKTKNIWPDGKSVWRAFDLCPYDSTRVVILGQDPYHTPGTADGLAFSTQQANRPASLEVIFKEIYRDLNIQYFYNVTYEEYFPTNNLEKWARNGFLLLNTSLTVEEGKPGSHKDIGWDFVMREIIEKLCEKNHVIFLLWGNEAQKYESLIAGNRNNVYFKAPHPAAELYNKGNGPIFSGCRHFSILRDCIPVHEGRNLFNELNLDACFDKELAKKLIKENFPMDSDRLCQYIDKELLIRIPFNKEKYWEEVRHFEEIISTKY